jgi:hypothetical protein
MHIPLNLAGFFWSALGVAGVSLVGLLVGVTMLLGTVPHRKVALPLVWISASVLAAALVAVVLILMHG